jgi:hypothetical protein
VANLKKRKSGNKMTILTNMPIKEKNKASSALSFFLAIQNPMAIKNPSSGNNKQMIRTGHID